MQSAPPESGTEPEAAAARRPAAIDLLAGGLLAATVILHVVAMLPHYFGGAGQASLWSQPDQAAEYVVLAAGWALALGLGLSSPARAGVAAGLAVGIGATELGFRLSDLGDVFRYGSGQAAAGLWLMSVAWAVGAAGAAVAVIAARRRAAQPAIQAALPEPPRYGPGAVVLVAALALATAGAFLPAWNRYVGVATTTGRSISFNLGNAFSGPWQVVLGTVISGLALAVVPILAVRLRARAVGAAVVAGSLVVLASQFVSAIVQVGEAVPPSVAGLNATQANQLGLQLHMTLSGWFTFDVLAAFGLFVATMVLAHARLEETPPGFQASSVGTWPSAPDSRRAATLPWS
jgi:hypothetical protein